MLSKNEGVFQLNQDVTSSSSPRDLERLLEQLREKRSLRHHIGIVAGVIDLLAISTAYLLANLVYLYDIQVELTVRTLASVTPIYLLFGLARQSYDANLLSDGYRSAWRAAEAIIWSSLFLFLIFFFLKIGAEFSRVALGLGMLFSIILASVGRYNVGQLALRELGTSPFAHLCIYDGIEIPDPKSTGSVKSCDIGLVPMPDNPAMLALLGRLALGLDGVVVHCSPEKRQSWALMLKSLDVRTELVVRELTPLQPLAIASRRGDTSLVLGGGQLSFSQRTLKRAFDLVFTLALAPVLVPLLILLGVVVKLDSPGPALFKQDRIGIGNRKFTILKFRTMRIEEQDEEARETTARDDPRVTRIGNFLRRTSLDELPQFLNVLRGEMSLVGPRPHAELTAIGSTLLWEIDAAYWHRHVVKPGITGLAQVRGHRGSLSEESHLRERLNSDLEYAANWSLTADLMIMIRTLAVMVHKNAF